VASLCVTRPDYASFCTPLLEEDEQTWINDELKTILNPDSCDGMVAAEQNHLTYEALTSLLSNNIFRHTTNPPGVRSPSGCGPNSQYMVT
jgi:hypothetical protein